MCWNSWRLSEDEWRRMPGVERFWHCVRQAAFFRGKERERKRQQPDQVADWNEGLLQVLRSGSIIRDIGYCPPLNLLEVEGLVPNAGDFRCDTWHVTTEEWQTTLVSETYHRRVAEIARKLYEMRTEDQVPATADDDWVEAEYYIRRRIETIKIALFLPGCRDDLLKLRLMVMYYLATWAGLRPSEVTDDTPMECAARDFSVLFGTVAGILRVKIGQLPTEAKTVGQFLAGMQKFACD